MKKIRRFWNLLALAGARPFWKNGAKRTIPGHK